MVREQIYQAPIDSADDLEKRYVAHVDLWKQLRQHFEYLLH